jgi:hypothetical protein
MLIAVVVSSIGVAIIAFGILIGGAIVCEPPAHDLGPAPGPVTNCEPPHPLFANR